MSIFPTTVLLATDGSEGASSATEAAVEISDKTGSELHVVHVYGVAPIYPLYPGATDPGGAELEDPVLEQELESLSEKRAREVLDAAVEEVTAAGGELALPRMAVSGVGWLAYVKDTEGNMLGLMQPDASAA